MLPQKNRIDKKMFPEFIKTAEPFFSNSFHLKVVRGCSKNKAFAFVVSLKVSKRAVERNKLKRRARAITASLFKNIVPGICAAVFFKPATRGQDYAEMKSELTNLYKKAKII